MSIKLFWKRAARVLRGRIAAKTRAALASHDCFDWRRDPLSHPALEAMSLVELADLPARQLRSCCRE
jgi:hypothetical protein